MCNYMHCKYKMANHCIMVCFDFNFQVYNQWRAILLIIILPLKKSNCLCRTLKNKQHIQLCTSQAVMVSAPDLTAIIDNRPLPVPISSTLAFLSRWCMISIAACKACSYFLFWNYFTIITKFLVMICVHHLCNHHHHPPTFIITPYFKN